MAQRNRRLSLQAVSLLAVMLEDPTRECWGAFLCEQLGLAPGTVYPLLSGLEEKGILSSRPEDIDPRQAGRPRRRLYRLSGEGEVIARREIANLHATVARVQPRLGLT